MKKRATLIMLSSIFALSSCASDEVDTPIDEEIVPTQITLSDSSIGLFEGETKQLSASVLPENASNKTVTWSVSEGNDYVTISETGFVTAVKEGTAVILAKTTNDLSASCSVTVLKKDILPESITISDESVTLKAGETKQLSATVLPENASDKTVTWSIIDGEEVASVSLNGLITSITSGNAVVQASTINGKTCTCNVVVSEIESKINAYINVDTHNLVDKVFEKNGDEDFKEVAIAETLDNVPVYSFSYGATVKIILKDNGYFVATGIKVNDQTFECVNGEVVFLAVVDDPDDPLMNFLDIEVLFMDTTPIVGDYTIEVSEPAHISLVFKYADNGQETKGCSQGDKIIIVPVASDPDYEIKTIVGYSYTTNDTILHKTYFDILKNDDGTYHFTCPFSHEAFNAIYIEATEANNTAFKGHELVGDYAVVRTYGLSESSSYINSFEKDVIMSFASSGEITYKEEIAYASDAENGVVNAMFTTSSIKGYYGDNLLVLGQSGSGQSIITPLTQDSTDLIIGVKLTSGMEVSDFVIDSFVFKVESSIYGVFSFYYDGKLYASCYVDVTNKTITTGLDVKQYLGTRLDDQKTVFELFDDKNNSVVHVGFKNDGGKGNYVFITSRQNGYVDANHSLVFTSDDTAIYDDYVCKVTGSGNDIVLDAPTKHIEITLDPTTLTYIVTAESTVVAKTLDIANLTFNGKSGSGNNLSVVFGSSNDSITGRIIEIDGCAYFWEFTAEFDSSVNELILTIVNVGYYYTYRPESTYNYSDEGALKGTRRIAVEDGKLTFIDNISGMTSYWITKNCVVTCSDFHF